MAGDKQQKEAGMSEKIEIGYVCRQGHFQFRDDPDGDSCGTKDIGTVYVEAPDGVDLGYLKEVIDESLASLHGKLEYWRRGGDLPEDGQYLEQS